MFDEDEKSIRAEFEKKFVKEIEIIDKLFEKNRDFFLKLKKGARQVHVYIIEVLLGSSLIIFYRSYRELSIGYLKPSIALMRVALENLIFSMYYLEFPEDIKYKAKTRSLSSKLSKIGYQKQTLIENMLERIDAEGKILKTKIKNEKDEDWLWYKILYENLVDMTNNFVHANFTFIHNSLKSQNRSKDGNTILVLGPHDVDIEPDAMKNTLKQILLVLMFQTLIFQIALEEHIPDEYKDEIKDLLIESANIHNNL